MEAKPFRSCRTCRTEVVYRIKQAADRANADFVLIEIGGTVGEYENILFLGARASHEIRVSGLRSKHHNASYMPIPTAVGEMKTKPTQQAIRLMAGAGLTPDFVVARSSIAIDEPRRKKLSLFGNVREDLVIGSPDVSTIYEVPLVFEEQLLSAEKSPFFILDLNQIETSTEWKDMVDSGIKKRSNT